ncbi:DUF4269 domain-containing protein [Symbiobacterium thermophilum]|uniref:HIT domain-containing protein n=1 Tax=Symbiobacterium thermophilum TaxID=2734 RepID=A0A953LJI2_SYMTR|nr:DUF4269 domain-containing protein [Symbiobacterium thermophilum]MBY6278271.1 hypothetical protein [Symbiobacterium thermophilum]
MLNWEDLRHGTAAQRAAYAVLKELGIMDTLGPYHPVLAGTFPLDLNVPGSDLDIICEVHDIQAFRRVLTDTYGHLPGFEVRSATRNGLPTVVCNFTWRGVPVEVFGQPVPTRDSSAFRHMAVEARLLALAGTDAAAEIRRLKAGGLKTEPAFAQYFALPGDPYETLLTLADRPAEELERVVRRARQIRAACPFCQIAMGAEASLVYEDPYTLAFLNLCQANPGHVLVIPKRHVERVCDLDDDLTARLGRTVARVSRAIREALGVSDLNVFQNNGEPAGQEIFHVHFHLLPRRPGDGLFRVYPERLPPHQSRAVLDALADRIRAQM